MDRRRSPRLHPQVHGAGAPRRRSPRLHPQIHESEEGAGVTRRTVASHAAAAASLPDDDDMLREILLRLPPQPSSLPRASAVCKRWRGLVTDPMFHRQFCAHHRKPPLLGFFHATNEGIVFTPVLDPPNRIPPQRFDLGQIHMLDCRHGLVLFLKKSQEEVVVCDPITRVQRRVAIPLELRNGILVGAVLCAAAAAAANHAHSIPFRVVLVSIHKPDYRPLACVYSSETGLWGNLISTEATCQISQKRMVRLGHRIYWFSLFDGILEFDLDQNSLTVIEAHLVTNDTLCNTNCQIIEAEDGVLGLAILSYPRFQLRQRNVNAHGVATWVPWKTIEIHSIPGLPPQIEGLRAWLLGYDEDTDILLFYASSNVYGIQLKLVQATKLYKTVILSMNVDLSRVSIHQAQPLLANLMELKCYTMHRMTIGLMC